MRLDRRMQQRDIIPETLDDTVRTCYNCGHVYTGRVCPQCGQAGTWKRYTWWQAFRNFLDIWGLGNRPMFRTLKELFWRPGYMIRDYLDGHRQFYFPPFKLLAVSVALLIFTSWLTGVKYESYIQGLIDDWELKEIVPTLIGPLATAAHSFMDFAIFLSSHPLYEWLFVSVIILVCVWVAFRRYGHCNLVETYIFLIFVLAQQLLLMIPTMAGSALLAFVKDHTVLHLGNTVALPIRPIHGFLDVVGNQVTFIYALFTNLLIILDFRQFYGLKWKPTLMRLLYSALIGTVILIVWVFYFVSDMNKAEVISFTVYCLMATSGFYGLNKYLQNHRKQITQSVAWACRALAIPLLIYFVPAIITIFWDSDYNLFLHIVMYAVTTLFLVAASLLPAMLYRVLRKTWLSWLTVPVVPMLLYFSLDFVVSEL